MTISQLDLDFASVTWMVNQNVHTLNASEINFLETLFTQYCDYARGSKEAKKNVRFLIDTLLDNDPEIQSKYNIPTFASREEEAVFGLNRVSEAERDDIVSDVDLDIRTANEDDGDYSPEEKTDFSSQQVKRQSQKMLRTRLMEGHIRKLPEGTDTDDIFKMMKILAKGQLEMQSQNNIMLAHLQQRIEQDEAERMALRAEIKEVNRQNVKLQADLDFLVQKQLKDSSITDVPWEKIPDFFRKIYADGIKRTAFALVKLPLTITRKAVQRILFQPVVAFYNFSANKIDIVVGAIWVTIIIAGAIHIYRMTDFETVNYFYSKYGGEYVTKYAFSGVNFAKEVVPQYLPGAHDLFESVKLMFFEKIVSPVYQAVWIFWQGILHLFTTAVSMALQRLPMANLWFTQAPADTMWTENPIYLSLKGYFGL
jgi:uncharacterized protein YfcZ (UPF0381/DUF406 family)